MHLQQMIITARNPAVPDSTGTVQVALGYSPGDIFDIAGLVSGIQNLIGNLSNPNPPLALVHGNTEPVATAEEPVATAETHAGGLVTPAETPAGGPATRRRRATVKAPGAGIALDNDAGAPEHTNEDLTKAASAAARVIGPGRVTTLLKGFGVAKISELGGSIARSQFVLSLDEEVKALRALEEGEAE